MRVRLLSTIAAIGMSVLGTSASFAAPAAGAAINGVAPASQLTQKVWWRGGWHGGWGWHRGWGWGGPGWCYYHPYRCGGY
jgi:hypothetical protein